MMAIFNFEEKLSLLIDLTSILLANLVALAFYSLWIKDVHMNKMIELVQLLMLLRNMYMQFKRSEISSLACYMIFHMTQCYNILL